MITVKEIVEKYLVKNGYDGLFNVDSECACRIDDLMPCEGEAEECEAGHLVPCTEGQKADGADWCIGRENTSKEAQ